MLVLNGQTGRYVRLGQREFHWLISLDGKTRQEDVARKLGVEEAFAEELLSRLAAAKLIAFSESPIEGLELAEASTKPRAKIAEWETFGQLRIKIPYTEKLLASLSRLAFLRNKAFLIVTVWFALLGVGVGIRLIQTSNLAGLVRSVSSRWYDLAALVLMIFLTTMVHELGHATVCAQFGVSVRSIGVMLYYFQPAAYADVTDSWRLQNKWHRIAISFAGLYVQGVVSAIAALVYLTLKVKGHGSSLVLLFIILNIGFIVFNLIPLIKLDGYWILSNILGISNLRDRAQEFARQYFTSLMRRKPIDPKKLRYNAVLIMSPMGRGLLACYGISCNMFGVAMWLAGLSLLFRASRWIGFRGSRNYFFVICIVALVGTIFAAQALINRRKGRRGAQPAATVKYNIDRDRAVRFNPFAIIMDDRQGKITFAWASPNQLQVEGNGNLSRLIPSLREGISLRQLENRFGTLDASVDQLLQQLWHGKHLRYCTDWEFSGKEARFSRQLGWLSFNTAVRGSEKAVLSRLASKSVTVLGVGGVGSNVALNLAAAGIGALHIVDGDTVELSNLNRQLLYTPSDIGRPKTEVAAERLKHFNPSIQIRTTHAFLEGVKDITEAIEGADYVIRAVDTPLEIQTWVNEACVKMKIPFIGAGFMPQGALIGPTVLPGTSACLACHQGDFPHFDRGIGPSMTTVATMTASIVANEALTYLAELGDVRTSNGILWLDVPTFATRFQEIIRDENCAVCGRGKTVAV